MAHRKMAVLITNTLLGTDALITLDGRWNEDSIDNAVREHIERIRPVHQTKQFLGYEVYGAGQSLSTGRPQWTVTFRIPV